MKSYREFSEAIKGWKHAGSDISKHRAEKGKDVSLVSLTKSGAENKMSSARTLFRSEAEALEHHNRVKLLNPKMSISHNLYIDGKFVKKLD